MSATKIWGACLCLVSSFDLVGGFWCLYFGLKGYGEPDPLGFIESFNSVSIEIGIYCLISAILFGGLGTWLIERQPVPSLDEYMRMG